MYNPNDPLLKGTAIFLSLKRPNDTNFRHPIKISETAWRNNNISVNGAYPVIGKDGTVYVFWGKQSYSGNGYGPSSIVVNKSYNGGLSFTGQYTIKGGISDSEPLFSFQYAHSWPYVAVNPVDGSLNMVYGSGTSVLFSYSTDNG